MVLVGGGYARGVCGWVETREGGEEGGGVEKLMNI